MKTKKIFRAKLCNDFNEPYWAKCRNENKPIVRHVCLDEYTTSDFTVFKDILDGFLDAPKKKMTAEDVRKDFGINVSDSRVEAILEYYNGRFHLKNVVDAEVKDAMSKARPDFPVVLKYDIPFKMNFFSVEDDDPYEKQTEMNGSYLEIEVSKVCSK